MLSYIVKRLLLSVLTIVMISFITFVIIKLPPGDYANYYYHANDMHAAHTSSYAGDDADEVMRQLREELGLNRPLIIQWWDWFSGIVFRWDFGNSYTGSNTGATPNLVLISSVLPATILIAIFTMVITWTLSIPIGIYSAMRQHSIGDYIFTSVGFAGLAVPDFLLGLVLMYLFFAYFDHSVGGLFSAEYLDVPWSMGRFIDLLEHLIIPGIVMGTAGTAGLIRIMRNNLLDELGKPYVVTALAKGKNSWKVVIKYPFRVAINPLISSIGYMIPALISGTVIVSIVLSLPTLGPELVAALMRENMTLAGSIILMLGVLTVVGTLISDLLLIVVDPRIRMAE